MAEAALRVGSRFRAARPAAIVAFALLGAALAWHAVSLVRFGLWAIGYPYELDYGEGIVWQQMRLMLTDHAYGAIDGFPAIVFHYPPVYHLVSLGLAELAGIDQLAAGRTVSLVAMLAAAGFGGAIVHRVLSAEAGRQVAAVGAAVAALAMLSNWPVLFWTPVMRVDLLALAFSFAGVYLALRALERPAIVHAAAIAFALAVYTKHSMIAAPAACFLVLLFLEPRTAAAGITTAVVLGFTVLAALWLATDGGFARHLFLYNINRFDPAQFRLVWLLVGSHAVYFGMAALAVKARLPQLLARLRAGGAARARIAADPAAAMLLVLLAYLAVTTVMLLLMGKSGANQNYMIEWMCVIALFVGLAARDAARLLAPAGEGEAGTRSPLLPIMAVAALAVQVAMLPTNRFQQLQPLAPRAELAALSQAIAAADKPVISDDMVLLLRSGKEVVWEPAIFAELASIGKFDERPFIAMIEDRAFAFFITFRARGEATFDSRYNPAVADAIDRAYPVKQSLAGYTIHSPRD